ncbi:hypothetical protein Glove_395g22 [Diversispora epigaea]|uniref:Protein kinase domain-containing protein n=1 Tax=Diversispora epigaea TaxID=1348612 RepID=A0A397H1H4_9GLOM|nr:hypothetical protein Glove_395g22 [Diversispora epigaea]
MGLMHKYFHSGNIINQTLTHYYITDFGMCKPLSENDPEKIYGVTPYMAPETLSRGEYTQVFLLVWLKFYPNEMHPEAIYTSRLMPKLTVPEYSKQQLFSIPKNMIIEDEENETQFDIQTSLEDSKGQQCDIVKPSFQYAVV